MNDAVTKGATAMLGGGMSKLGVSFVKLALLTNISTDMRVFREEIFGPVVSLVRFDTEE